MPRPTITIPALGLLLGSMITMAATPLSEPANSTARSSDEAYIVQCERDWAASVATGDATAVERCLADDFLGVDPDGKMYDKKTMVADTRNGPKYFASNHLDAVKVRFFGETAVAQGHESWQRHKGEKGRFVWTDTWLKRNGKWQIVAAEDLIVLEPAHN